MKNFNIMGVHQFLGEGGHKKTMHRGNFLKIWPGQFAGGLAKKSEDGGFDGGGMIPRCTL